MPFLRTLLTTSALLLLTHAIYSAHEHTTLVSRSTSASTSTPPSTSSQSTSSSSSNNKNPSLPPDIILETLLATLALTWAIVASAPPLQLIRWAEWGGMIEREGWVPGFEDARGGAGGGGGGEEGKEGRGAGAGSGVGNPYRALEERRGFWDVRAARKAFADFIREGGGGG